MDRSPMNKERYQDLHYKFYSSIQTNTLNSTSDNLLRRRRDHTTLIISGLL